MHEAKLHDRKCFVTLTYAPEHIPASNSVSRREMQLFMKRLRKECGHSIRFFACGEYGDDGQRPHYHLMLFGIDFSADRTLWRKSGSGHLLYRSPTLEKLWPFGFSEIGSVTKQSAAYVARYVLKKRGGKLAESYYTRPHPATGELLRVDPEFIQMSNRPGIGHGWYELYAGDAFPSDFLIMDGKRVPVPRYYQKKLEEKEKFSVHIKRRANSWKHQEDRTPERLATREEVQALKARLLVRKLEK